ncbi:hypothetical protein [Actinomyces ruminicola]|uniref:Uncharacterized protein n=1 Tax=Actinomyces ruminicola TaxID=332524 RepID=A0A1G9VQT8_9ACTO|nr:hypothetical protein [Actinomyces ruminicola]SDM74539.1 hypothetical protein SAMN04487766_106104 [Actinomyces ruminicola]
MTTLSSTTPAADPSALATGSPTPRPAPNPVRDPEAEAGLYGPRGWTVRAGVWHALADCRDELRSTVIPAQFGFAPAGIITADGTPEDDYTPFHDLGPTTARRLLDILPAEQLADRQNLGPTLGALLRACVRADGRVRLSGYGIGPQRRDERISVEGLWIEDPDLLDTLFDAVDALVGDDCDYCDGYDECDEWEDRDPADAEELEALVALGLQEVWRCVAERYELDARSGPDEIKPLRRHWTHGPLGTWLWWD